MSSTFAGLTNAMAAISAQRYGLDVTGQNVANADTPGYTRQRAELAGVGPVAGVPSIYATPHASGGVTVTGTSRLNDPVVDGRARAEHGRNGTLQTSASTLSNVESLFNEPSDTGLADQLNEFWNAWSPVANHPDDLTARGVALEKAAGLVGSLNASSAALDRLTQGVTAQLTDVTGKISTAAGALAKLNGAMVQATASGINTNALADQRDVLLMQLADLAGAQTANQPDGSVTVTLGGQTLVAGTTANTVAVDSSNQVSVGGNAATTAGGVLRSLRESLTTVLPAYAAKLDGVAAALANSVNGLQQGGYDLSGAPGGPLFTGTTAAGLNLAATDPAKLAASATPGGNLDGSIAVKLSDLGKSATGGDAAYRQFVTGLGADVQNVTQQAAVQQAVTGSVDELAQSAAGVNLDEETSALLTYQRAFQASSRVLSTVDEMLDTLINRTGKVGL